jgi:hypothetical protein
MRRERELAGGILSSNRNRNAIDEPVEETESVSRPVGLGVRWVVGTLEADPEGAGRVSGVKAPVC